MRLWDKILMSLEGAVIAIDSLRANKVRAALTISGVAVGVFVVVAMGAAVHGIRESFQKDMDEFGTSSFQVRRRNPGFNACNPTSDNCPDRRYPGISIAEWRAVQQLPEVENAMAWLMGGGTVVYRDRQVKNVGYDAQSTEWIETDQADVFPGRTFTESEHDAAALVAIVNTKLALARAVRLLYSGFGKSAKYTFHREACPKCGVRMEGDPDNGSCNSCQHHWGEKTAADFLSSGPRS